MRVCILGNGLTSLSLAKSLINRGLKVDLFSNNDKNIYNKSQTLGISKSNVDYFNKNILDINKLLWDINKIEIYSEKLNNEKILNFENKSTKLFSIVKNFELYNYLLFELKKSKLFKIKKLSDKIFFFQEYCLVINCDDNHQITKKFFYKKFFKNYNSHAHVTIFDHSKLLSNNIAVQVFTKNGPLAFLPISETQTSVVYSLKGRKIFNKKVLMNLIRDNSKKYNIKKIHDFKSFELKSSDLRNYYYKNILAFGNLLHRLHPLAGQGFNMVIRDIKVLLQLIEYKNNLGIQLDSSICIEFEKKIKHHNYLFSNGIDFIYEFFNIESKINNKLISKSIKLFGKNQFVNKSLIKMADNGIIF